MALKLRIVDIMKTIDAAEKQLGESSFLAIPNNTDPIKSKNSAAKVKIFQISVKFIFTYPLFFISIFLTSASSIIYNSSSTTIYA